jgi:hypothetical protein
MGGRQHDVLHLYRLDCGTLDVLDVLGGVVFTVTLPTGVARALSCMFGGPGPRGIDRATARAAGRGSLSYDLSPPPPPYFLINLW